jgi:Fe-S oxidoreductase
MPEDLIRRAKALKVVRDGWAGFYFHWYLDPDLLRQTVQGLKDLGYEFTVLSGELK